MIYTRRIQRGKLRVSCRHSDEASTVLTADQNTAALEADANANLWGQQGVEHSL